MSNTDLVGSKDKVPVLWVEARKVLKTRSRTVLGICGFSKRVFRITSKKDVLSVLMIQDIYVEPKCEERYRCLDVDCPKNETTWETLKHYLGIRSKKKIDIERRINYNRGPNGELQDFKELFDE